MNLLCYVYSLTMIFYAHINTEHMNLNKCVFFFIHLVNNKLFKKHNDF